MVARIDARHHIPLGVREKLEARGGSVQARQPQRRGTLPSRRNIDRQALQRDPPFARAQVRKPDQAEGEDRRRIAFGRTGDGRPTVLPMTQKCPREGR
jgi:hypothetical protein